MNLAVQQQVIEIPEGSWVGNISMAGFGFILLVLSVLCIRGRKKKGAAKGSEERVPMFLWGPVTGAIMDRVVTEPSKRAMVKIVKGKDGTAADADEFDGFDWRSLMTFLIGLWAMTSILSSTPGAMLSLAEWFQGLLLAIADWPFISDIGAAGICFFLLYLAMRSRDDDILDLTYGALCGLVFPLGGGTFAEITLYVGNWIPRVLQLG